MIDQVSLYTYTTIKGPGIKSGSYTYLLEYMTDKGPATLTKHGTLENVTEHQAHMRIFREGMERMTRPCEVMVYTDSRYLQQGVEEWLKRWQEAGWINKKGKPVANKEEWKKIAELLGRNLISFQVGGHHSYRDLIQYETEKNEEERRKCLTGLEPTEF